MDDSRANPLTVAKARLSQRHLLSALNETSAAARNGWLLFLALMGYLIVALAGITHENLLLNTPVQLPILNIKVALDRFFLFAPLFLLFVHGGMIIQHIVLARKIDTFNELIKVENRSDNGLYHPLRYELHSYMFVQSFAGPPGSPLLQGFFRTMVSTSLWILPILLLVYFQVAFLPYHDPVVTNAHRLYIVIDLALLIGIGVFVNQPETLLSRALSKQITRRPLHFVIATAGIIATLFFSFLVATIPDSSLDRFTSQFPAFKGTPLQVVIGKEPGGEKDRYAFLPTAWLFENLHGNAVKRGHASFFQRNLVVTDRDLVPNKEDDFGEVSQSLRNRDLRYAILNRTDLHRVDFTGANLSGASLIEANLRDSMFSCSTVDQDEYSGEDRSKDCTRLVGADLRKADLTGAILRGSNLQFASLEAAILSRAELEHAVLQGANLSYAKMRRTNLKLSQLQGADLSWSKAQGANFSLTELQGGNLQGAFLVGANFEHSQMQGADLSLTSMMGTVLRNAKLFKTDFSSVNLALADVRKADIFGAGVPDDLDALTLADISNLETQKPALKKLSELNEKIAKLPPKIAAIVREKLGDTSSVAKLDWDAKDSWTGFIEKAQMPLSSAQRQDLTNRLGNLGCLDKSEEGALINAVVERALYQFNGDTMLLYNRILSNDCSPVSKVSKAKIEQLQKAASEYQKKIRAARLKARRAKVKAVEAAE